MPRLMLVCRLVGHRPVVDGTAALSVHDTPVRWVVCDRCGVRPDPQGSLDAQQWNVGDRYTGPWGVPPPVDPDAAFAFYKSGPQLPGPFTAQPTGTLGGELVVLARAPRGLGFTLKVGNGGSEQTLAASLHLWWASLYLHTERFGTWLQRRLNPVGYESRVIELEAHSGHLWWRLWTLRDGWSSRSGTEPRWRHGSLQIDPRTLLLGEKRYSYANQGAAVTATLRMPHGDEHPVHLQLQRRTFGRKRGRKRLSWSVDWEAPRGVPTRRHDGRRIYGSGVSVSEEAVRTGGWPAEAVANLAVTVTRHRYRNDWTVEAEVAA
ncbi:hypothetical protein KBX50_05255 [Micromonospora sp. C51]|uniref:hypothetical protein n=1 Tax=Micromonospora sp. C51 TaxID=2824879 RepID=UPI001B35A700|nr:hypothetical protein [Micromonospora sp. C51]MBQ1047866.1 hypothetical protein [Micromonospora sp. C51]